MHIFIFCILYTLCILFCFGCQDTNFQATRASLHCNLMILQIVEVLSTTCATNLAKIAATACSETIRLCFFYAPTRREYNHFVFCMHTMIHHTPFWTCLLSLWTGVLSVFTASPVIRYKYDICICIICIICTICKQIEFYAYFAYYAY